MKKLGTIVALSMVLVLGVACDSDSGGGSSAASPEAAASNSAASAQDMGALKADKGSEEGLGAALKLYGDLQALSFSGASSTESGMSGTAYPLQADCLQTDADGNATYTDCEVAGATFNGTVTGQGDAITLDITIDVGDPGSQAGVETPVKSVQVTEKGTLTITEAMIQGTIDIGIAMELDLSNQPGMSGLPAGIPTTVNQSIEAIFDVTLTDGCVTGGTIKVQSSGGMTAAGASSMTATFTACGEVTVQ